MEPTTITLETPLTRGDMQITAITLRQPTVGALRGVSLRGVIDMEVAAITTVLPRITEPALIEAEVARLDPADILQCGMVIASFFVPKGLLQEAKAQAGFPA